MDPIVYALVVLFCLLLSAFFSGSETALLRLTKDQIESDIEKTSHPSIMAARDLIKTPAKLLVTILLGNNVVNILAASCASALGVYFLGERDGLIASTVAMTLIVLVFSEILPKSIAARNPARIGYFFALPLYIIHRISFPFHFLYERAIEPLVRLIAGDQVASSTPPTSIAESVLKLAEELRVKRLDGTPIPIIGAAAKAGSLLAVDIMTDRSDIFGFSGNKLISEAEVELAKSKYTRALVFDEDIDEIVGSVHLKDLVRANNRKKEGTVRDLAKSVISIPEKMPILEILPRMQRAFIHIAVVKDGNGGTQGLVTQEDVLEELVGEIRDEFDLEELKRVKKISTNVYQILGRVSVRDLNRETFWDIPGDRGDTINDILFNTLGRFPEEGDVIEIESYQFKVISTSGRRLARLEVTKVIS